MQSSHAPLAGRTFKNPLGLATSQTPLHSLRASGVPLQQLEAWHDGGGLSGRSPCVLGACCGAAQLRAAHRSLPCCRAEALEDFLLNYLEVSPDEGSGKAVTRPKYMEMLVGGRRHGPRWLPPGGQFKRAPRQPTRLPAPCALACLQQDIANRQRSTLDVDLDDLDGFSKDPELVEHVEGNTQQYLRLLAEAADNIMPAPTDDNLPEDVFDVLLDQVGGGVCQARG